MAPYAQTENFVESQIGSVRSFTKLFTTVN
jgi:hypothetical protein